VRWTPGSDDPDFECLIVDPTIDRPRQHAVGEKNAYKIKLLGTRAPA
jgi:hypothetical protein